MTTVTKTVKFDAAHILTNHEGLCKNLHGHTYRVDVSVAQDDGVGGDMVIDFKDLKRIASEVVCERFDHAFIDLKTFRPCPPPERFLAMIAEGDEK